MPCGDYPRAATAAIRLKHSHTTITVRPRTSHTVHSMWFMSPQQTKSDKRRGDDDLDWAPLPPSDFDPPKPEVMPVRRRPQVYAPPPFHGNARTTLAESRLYDYDRLR